MISLPLNRPYGTHNFLSNFIPSDKSLGYCQPPLMGLEESAAFRVQLITRKPTGKFARTTKRILCQPFVTVKTEL